MYAIVDIETTGGHAGANGITEIAIALHDGRQITDFYETLVNPLMPIPRYVQSLTGITNAMVSQAPLFDEVASKIFEMLRDRIFVAHNVNFDFSFVKHQLSQSGFHLDTKKLCTVRAGRTILPGFPSYSLGNLCRSLGINVENRHRAGGDTMATVKLLECLIEADHKGYITGMLKGKAKEQYLPPNLPVEKVAELPAVPGVYYFHNQKGKVVYVGKAKDLRKRVASHFSNNKPGRQKQEFLREIHNISFETCGTELMAFILESIEIKRLWPLYNRSQKTFEQAFGLYIYEDGRGFRRLFIEKKKKQLQPIYTFNLLIEGHNLLIKLVKDFELCPRLCFIDKTPGQTLPEELSLEVSDYNGRVQNAIDYLINNLPSFAVVEESVLPEKAGHQTVVIMEKGKFYGMGYAPKNLSLNAIEELKTHVTQYPENSYIRGLVYQYAQKFPHRKRVFE